MSVLDQKTTYSTYDKSEISYGIEHFPEQIAQGWAAVRMVTVPKRYANVDRIVVVGMGGSALGPHVLKSILFDRLSVPFEIVRGYHLPKYVNSKTLVILSSFSGTTEEVLSAAKEAVAKKAKTFAIAVGDKLGDWAAKEQVPFYQIVPGELAKQPRLGLGFSLVGVLGCLHNAGILKVKESEIKSMMRAMSDVIATSSLDVPAKDNPAKTVAEALSGRMILVVAAQHLVGSAHILSNQFNETSKQMAFWQEIPELQHHILESTQFPKNLFEKVTVLMIQSDLYHDRIKKRFSITADMFEDQGAEVIEYKAQGDSLLEEVSELLQFGNYTSFYLGMLNKVDPEPIPFVDAFKERMKKK